MIDHSKTIHLVKEYRKTWCGVRNRMAATHDPKHSDCLRCLSEAMLFGHECVSRLHKLRTEIKP